jgi:hypothetical protein
MSRSTDGRARPPQPAQERIAVANLPPAAPHDAGGAPVDGPAHLPPATAVADVKTREVVVVAGGERPVVHVAGEVVAPPAAALPRRSPRHHARRHAAPVAEAVLPGETLQARILLRRPRRRRPDAEDRRCRGRRDGGGGAHRKWTHACLLVVLEPQQLSPTNFASESTVRRRLRVGQDRSLGGGRQ